MERSDESETALPQKDSLSDERWGQPSDRTSVAVSERAQQNDCWGLLAHYPTSPNPALKHETKRGKKNREDKPNPTPSTPSPHS